MMIFHLMFVLPCGFLSPPHPLKREGGEIGLCSRTWTNPSWFLSHFFLFRSCMFPIIQWLDLKGKAISSRSIPSSTYIYSRGPVFIGFYVPPPPPPSSSSYLISLCVCVCVHDRERKENPAWLFGHNTLGDRDSAHRRSQCLRVKSRQEGRKQARKKDIGSVWQEVYRQSVANLDAGNRSPFATPSNIDYF